MKTAQSLSSWSWASIHKTYAAYATLLKKYEGYQKRCSIPKSMDINFSDENNILIARFWRDVKRIDAQLAVLDKEIARRNQLVGVI